MNINIITANSPWENINMGIAYFLIVISIIIFLAGLIGGVVMLIRLKGKRKWYTCLTCGCILPFAILLAGIGSWIFTQKIEEEKKVSSLEYYQNLYAENEKLKENIDQSDKKSGQTEENENIITPATPDKKSKAPQISYDYDIVNDKYGFLFDIGPAAKKIKEKRVVDQDWAIDFFTYCHETSDPVLGEDLYCPPGSVGIFSITVYDDAQYDEINNSELADMYQLIGIDKQNGYYYVFAHPNGEFPADVKPVQDIYDTVSETFIFKTDLDE